LTFCLFEHYEKHMPAQAPQTTNQSIGELQALGEQIRARRKALKVSATVAAEAAGMSRVTLHRIEKGEPSVAMGAWANAMAALGMSLQARATDETPPPTDLPGQQWT
jgi:DNA-binding XRE family transcriptional regulator